MRGRGIEVHARTQVARIEKAPREGYSVFTTIGQEISADLVMYATGRGTNTKGLGLDAVGVKTNERGAVWSMNGNLEYPQHLRSAMSPTSSI